MAKNIKTTVNGSKLLIEIDLGPKAVNAAKVSASRKTKLLASSEGNMVVEGVGHIEGLKLGLNCYFTNPEYQK